MGNLEPRKVKLNLEITEFYALQSIVEQWYAEHHLDYSQFHSQKVKVANDIRQINPNILNGTLTIN